VICVIVSIPVSYFSAPGVVPSTVGVQHGTLTRWSCYTCFEGFPKLVFQTLTGHFLVSTWRKDCRSSQKVIIGQGDTSPSQEMSVYTWETSPPSGNTKKGYKTQFPTWPRDHRVHCMPHAAFLVSSLQIKSDLCCWSPPLLSISEWIQEPSIAEDSCLSSGYHTDYLRHKLMSLEIPWQLHS
jgi:hypothetical protein